METKLENKKEQLWLNGFVVLPLANTKFVDDVRSVILSGLPVTADDLNSLDRPKFHEVIAGVQKKINDQDFNQIFFDQNGENIKLASGETDLCRVNVMKLRAVRPTNKIKPGAPDHVGFHRESLYADGNGIKHQYNLWVPVSKAAQTSGIFAVRNSHTLLDSSLVVEQNPMDPGRVERFSFGHKIGIPYAPKNIDKTPEVVNGDVIKIEVPIGCFLMFSTMLIN